MSYIAKFNPYSMDDESILALATGRKALLHQVLKSLKDNLNSPSNPQHLLIRGPRGMGKSFFLKYLQINFRRDDAFKNAEFLLLPEEQNNINSPTDLLKLILAEIDTSTEEIPTTLWEEPEDLWHIELQKLKDYLNKSLQDRENYLLVVVVENLDEFLRQIQQEKKIRKLNESRFRHLLEKIPGLCIIGATPRIDSEDIDGDYNKRLFHAFKRCTLKRWEEEDYFKYFDKRKAILNKHTGQNFSEEKESLMKNKLKALSLFTGGSPRMAVILTNLLMEDDVLSTAKTLFGLIDDLTPYYQDLTKSIPPKSKILFDTLIRREENLSQSELAEIVGTTQSKIAKAFLWLKDNGYIIGKKRINSKAFSYQVADRIHVLYYQLREVHYNQNITPIWLLSDFLLAFYHETELKEHARKHLINQPSKEANDLAKVYLLSAGFFTKDELPEYQNSKQWTNFIKEIEVSEGELERILSEIEKHVNLKTKDSLDKDLQVLIQCLIIEFGKIKNKNVFKSFFYKALGIALFLSTKKNLNVIGLYFCQQLIQILSNKKTKLRIGDLFRIIAWNHENLNNKEKAVKFYKKAFKESNEEENMILQVWLLGRIGWNYEHMEDHKKAVGFFGKALKLSSIKNDPNDQAKLYGRIGVNLDKLKLHKKAIENYKNAKQLYESENNYSGLAWSLGRIGWSLYELNKLEESIKFHKRASKVWEKEGNISRQNWDIGRIGLILIMQNKWNEASSLLIKGSDQNESIYKEFGDAVVFSEEANMKEKAFEVGNRLFSVLKAREYWMDVNLSLSKLFADWLEMKLSYALFEDLCEEALGIFPQKDTQTIIHAALHTIKFIQREKDPSYLEKLNPDMALALQAIVLEAKL